MYANRIAEETNALKPDKQKSTARQSRRRLFHALALLFGTSVATAAYASAALDAGVRAYREGDFAAALGHFRQALADEPDSSAALFNLGLASYRLKDYAGARRSFLALRERPGMAAVAEYHLGLVAARLGQIGRAENHLRAAAAGDSERLRELARAALQRLDEHPSARLPAAYLTIGGGLDDNRNRVNESIDIPGQDRESAYSEMYALLQYPVRSIDDLDLRATVFRRDYETDDELDQSALQLSARRNWRPEHWRLTLAAETESVLLRDDGHVNSVGLGFEGLRRVGSTTLRLRYQPAHITADPEFDYLDGWRHRASVSQDFHLGGLQWRAGYELEHNSGGNGAEDDIVYGQAPLRHGPFLRVSRALTPRIDLDLSSTWRHSRYREDADPQIARRNDDLVQLGASLRFQAARAWSVRLDYRVAENRSNVDTYDHDRQMALLALEWRY